MKIKQFDIWVADLNPQMGTEPGKVRPVLIVQTDLLNGEHSSTLICPITTNIQPAATLLRVALKRGTANLKQDCDILIDQLRAIDNKRLIQKLGTLPESIEKKVRNSLQVVLDL